MPVKYAPPRILSGGLPSLVVTTAPICTKGRLTRSIGRLRKLLSPSSSLSKFCPARRPANKRMHVPEFPQSIILAGFFKPYLPTPCTTTRSETGPSINTPIDCNAFNVDKQSAASKKPLMVVVPVAIAPNRSARCEIDLSPGTVISQKSEEHTSELQSQSN